ncbi:MAG: NAD(P)H-hydrate dehydratase [Arcicella sp.]|nr:NAD(P)H-hydrate dehydratase [Arcicella sp.]
MKIISSKQTQQLDAFTIENEPIISFDLMERAAQAFTNWLRVKHKPSDRKIKIFCGLGNNGGDGLAVARQLINLNYDIEVFILKYSDKISDDCQENINRLQNILAIQYIDNQDFIINFTEKDLIIDAILGSGLSRPTEGLIKEIILQINQSKIPIISVDIASGLFTDSPNAEKDVIIKPDVTLTFQMPKLAFMLPQNGDFVGNFEVLDIGLHQGFIDTIETKYFYANDVQNLVKKRPKFSHKGTFGHALFIGGMHGMMGAAVLASRACMRSGVGKLTVHVPRCGTQIMQISIPEALVWEAFDHNFINTEFWHGEILKPYNAVGIGPALGVDGKTRESLEKLFTACENENIPMVLDADVFNNLATSKGRAVIKKIPKNSILTPHPKEFEKLLGKSWKNDFEKLELLSQFAVNQQVIVCLKGANTAIALPDGTIHFNSTGNSGMAKAGTGDVLMGMILALLAQGYSPKDAAILGVYEHGLAGDKAAEKRGQMSMLASDLVEEIQFLF